MNKKKKRNMTLYVVIAILSIILFFWLVKMERRRVSNIEQTGIETVGNIRKKWESFGKGTAPYNVRFEFEHKGEKIRGFQELYNRTAYDNAIVGQQYKVKYLPKNPNKDAIIFIDDEPNERERNKTKIGNIISVTIMILLIGSLFLFGKKEHERIDKIKRTGVETVGTVIDKVISYPTAPGDVWSYRMHFEFEHNGKKIVVNQRLSDRAHYDNIIIGMKYKVKYLPDAPKNALIFTDEPNEKESNK